MCEWDGDKLTAWISTQAVTQSAQRFAQALEHSAGQRPRHHPVHGRRLRQQVRAGRRRASSARKLAKIAKLPVKLMLDRKEEHLDTGNRPSATAHIRAGVTADGKLTAFDGQSWGTGGAGAPRASRCRTSTTSRTASARTRTSTSTPASSAPMRAPGHPQGCFLTEILMDELADRVKMDPVAFRIKNLPPAAPNAMWAEYFARRREGVRLGQAASDRRRDARADQDRHGRVGASLGRRRPRLARALRHHVRRRRGR